MIDDNANMPLDGDITTGGSSNTAPTSVAQPSADTPEVTAARKALVKRLLSEVKADKKHWDKDFKRMRLCMKIAANGTIDKETAEAHDGSYVVPIVNRLIGVAVASLYAKNPRATAKRKQKLMYKLWDGDPQTLMAAFKATQPPVDPNTGAPVPGPVDPMTGQPQPFQPDPNAVALLQEVTAAKTEFLQYDRMAQTMELLFSYFLEEQDSGYKEQFKATVRRAKVCMVGYVELGFQRLMQRDPDIAARIEDVTSQISVIEATMAKAKKDPLDKDSANAEELRLLLQDLQNAPDVVVREGPTLSFPKAWEIIPDRRCKHLKTFAGARRVSREYNMSRDDILKTWKVDIGTNFTAYKSAADDKGSPSTDAAPDKEVTARVYKVWDKENQQVSVVCDGYEDFILEPSSPDVAIERFWTIFPLVLNEVEADGEDVSIFPPSDVWNTRHMQTEYNSSRQGKREHKIAGRPGWATAPGALGEEDKKKLAAKVPFEVLELIALATGTTIDKILAPIPVPGLDPNLYETESVFTDIQRSVGAQAANLGGTSHTTATESSIAEQSRDTSNASDVDDLDTMLSALSRGMGQLMLLELSAETVQEIAGPGAVWPEMPPTREQIVKDLILEVEAGSSGRPNNAALLANAERAMPWVQMLPGVNPKPLAKKILMALDIDPDDMFVEGAPSIAAINQMASHPHAPPQAGPSAPQQQGPQGSNNAQQQPAHAQQGPQPGYTPANHAGPQPA